MIGASHAAVQLADRLRAQGYEGEITLFSHESHMPYQRPPLSKAWLTGDATRDSIMLRQPSYYVEKRIELVAGVRVDKARRADDSVGLEFAHDGVRTSREFDRLVLATGARARRISIPGSDHRDVLVLRDLDHAEELASRVSAGPIVVIGGGFIGLEVAATARALGADVTVIEAGSRLLGRAVGPITADNLLAVHRARGIDVVLDATPAEITRGAQGIRGVCLEDGRMIEAATVLVGVGAVARTELAQEMGLHCAGGIVVDERCLASDGWTIAIGDCTVHSSPTGRHLRLESVDNAVEQGNVAVTTLLGSPRPQRQLPWFWSDQGDTKLQIVGAIDGHTSVVVRTDPLKPQRQVVLYFAGDALVAAECLNAPADFVALRSALSRGCPPGREVLADQRVKLSKLLAPLRQL